MKCKSEKSNGSTIFGIVSSTLSRGRVVNSTGTPLSRTLLLVDLDKIPQHSY